MVAAALAGLQGASVGDNARVVDRWYGDGALAGPAEQRLFAELEQVVPAGSVIAGNPWNGSALAEAVGGREVLFPHLSGAWGSDRSTVAASLAEVSTDRVACAAARRLGVDYVLAGRSAFWRDDPGSASTPVSTSRRRRASAPWRTADGSPSTAFRTAGDDLEGMDMTEQADFRAWVHRIQRTAVPHPDWALFYISVPKAAGTSLNVALTRSAASRFPGVSSIARRGVAGQPDHLGRGGRRQTDGVLADDAAYDRVMAAGLRHVFTVVRHPVERLLTTWSSKYLVRAPYYRDRLGLPKPGLRRFETVEEVLADLDQLVAHLHADPSLVHRDVHLVSQYELLRRDLGRFDHVGRTSRLGETIDWLRTASQPKAWSSTPWATTTTPRSMSASTWSTHGPSPGSMTCMPPTTSSWASTRSDAHLAGTLGPRRAPPTPNREVEHNVRAQVLHAALVQKGDRPGVRSRTWPLSPRRAAAL